jgi:hypothetical protein
MPAPPAPAHHDGWDRRDLRALALLFAALLLLVVLSWPQAEIGVHDEPAFINLAFRVSHDWRLVYDNFMFPISAVQGYWPAPFVRIFGESFTLVRLCFLPFAFGVIALQYWFCRKLSLDSSLSALAAATILACPLFLPLATVAMTDIPTLFFSQLCLALAFAASSASDRKRFLLLLSAAAAAGFLAGANRQVFWAMPALAIPGAALCQWRKLRCWLAPALIWTAAIAAVYLLIRWHSAQPGVIMDVNAGASSSLARFIARLWQNPFLSFHDLLRIALTLSLFCLPALLPGLATYLTPRRLRAAVFTLVALYAVHRWGLILVPWMIDMVNQYVMLPPFTDMVGDKPETVPPFFRSALTTGVLVILAGWSVRLWDTTREIPWRDRILRWPDSPAARYCFVVIPCSLAYLGALMLRFSVEQIFDRYLLPLACVALPLLLLPLTGQRFGSWRRAGWLAVPLLGLYGLVYTHDQFALGRARIEAGRRLAAAGIPRACIGGGYEFDAWTQFRAQGSFGVAPQRSRINYWFWGNAPSIWPRYIVATSPVPPLQPAPFQPVAYRVWAPPFNRNLHFLLDDHVPCPDLK